MTIYFDEARQRWRYDFRVSGRRHAGYCLMPDGQPAGNRTQAKRCEDIARAAALTAAPARSPGAQPPVFTVAQMFAAYATRKQGAKDWPNKRVYLAELLAWFGPDTPVPELTEQRVWEYVAWARQQPVMVYRGGPKARSAEERRRLYKPTDRNRADSTINRYLVSLGEALRIAHELKDGAGNRLLPELPRVPKLEEPEHLPRPVSDDDLQAIITSAPQHLADGVLLARLMGFRKGELFALTVSQVDVQNRGVWLEAAGTKANRAEFVAANAEAMEILERLVRHARAWKVPHLFTYKHGSKGKRRPVKDPKRAWRTVMKQLGLTHRFHDTKASYVTAIAHVAPAAVTQQLARHRSYETTRRYLRVADQAARNAVEAATFRLAASTTSPSVPQDPGSGSTREFHTGTPTPEPKEPKPLVRLVGATGFEPATPRPPV